MFLCVIVKLDLLYLLFISCSFFSFAPVVQAGKDVSYFGIILIGFAITGSCQYNLIITFTQ